MDRHSPVVFDGRCRLEAVLKLVLAMPILNELTTVQDHIAYTVQ